MRRTQESRRINWCFTDFCEPRITEDVPGIAPDQVRYLVAQKEICPDTGREHWQGYVQLNVKQRLSTVRNLLPGAHWEPAKGTVDENIAYCTKTDSRKPGTEPVFYGEPINKGTRTDLASFREAVKSGKRKLELIENYDTIFARYPRFYSMLQGMYRPAPVEREVILLIGPSGCGKSRYVHDRHGMDPEFYTIPLTSTSIWFDNYDGQKVVLLDEFAGAASKVSLVFLLRLIDRYVECVPVKGGYVWFNPSTIYITTNLEPSKWYDFTSREEQYKALLRRFTKVLHWQERSSARIYSTQEDIWDAFPYRASEPRIRYGESIRD